MLEFVDYGGAVSLFVGLSSLGLLTSLGFDGVFG